MKTWKKAGLALLALAGLLAVAAWLAFRLPAFGGVPDGGRLERMRLSRHRVEHHIRRTGVACRWTLRRLPHGFRLPHYEETS
jgi:hypothetical protein